MKTIDRKLLRDLWGMRGQALAIAMVIGSGVTTFIMSLSTLDSLRMTREIFYQEYRFSDVFASIKRAPERLAGRIREIPGVHGVETRVTAAVSLEVSGFSEPVTGHLVSIPDEGEPLLNRLYLREGRSVHPGRDDEVVVSEAFAEAHRLSPGDALKAVINGRRQTLRIVGTALSPEYIFQVRPGSLFPDFKRYGILWMGRTPLAAAYDMEGAFNDLVLALSAGTSPQEVIDRLDRLLQPYGGLGAYGRNDQISHRYLSEEFRQLTQMSVIFPVIFLGVAAYLVNIVIGRLIRLQREEIAALKAFGYRNGEIALHYVKLVIVIVLIGLVLGTLAGIWMGRGLSGIYMEFYRFPFLTFRLRPGFVFEAALVSAAAAILGALRSVRSAARQAPAEAMRPEAPVVYRESWIERLGLKRLFSQPTRMIIRHLERRPLRALLSVTGIAFSCAILIVGVFFEDAVDFMMDVQFGLSQREDLAVSFVEPTSREALHELIQLPGVWHGEPFRTVPVRLRFEQRSYRTALHGVEPGGDLQRLLDASLMPIVLPPSGLVLTDYLGTILGVRPGDTIQVEALEGARPVRQIPVTALVREYIGVSGYMRLETLNRLMQEGSALSGVYLSVDPAMRQAVYAALKERPRVAGTVVRESAIKSFYETMGDQVLIFSFFITILASTIALGVVYNSARITLSERGRELASLRVLGFTRGEISYILLGELAILTLAAIPVGFLIGRMLCAYIIRYLQTDLYRVPLILEGGSYAFAASVVLVSAILSGGVVRRQLDRLDLIGVLKSKE